MSTPQPLPVRLEVRAPAKINPFLAVGGVRKDGYHEMVTVYQTVALSDTLRLIRDGDGPADATPARTTRLDFSHDAGELVPLDGTNLVLAAATALARRIGVTVSDDAAQTTVLELTKRIPVAGGMAGGSVDAAAALTGLNRLWGADLSRRDLVVIAAELGADVPFCLVGGTAIGRGTGTELTTVLSRGTFDWLVCTSAEQLPTPTVFSAFDEHCRPDPTANPDPVLAAIAQGDAEQLGTALHNDLEQAADVLLPRLVGDRKALLDAGALGAVVSGSGPTLLAIAADGAEAQRIAGRVAGRFDQVHLTSSPAGGPVVSPI